jgi:tripartite-type tricarboxylate transporter receptor subunit TctC
MLRKQVQLVAAIALLGLAGVDAADAQAPDNENTVKLIIGHAPGGGFDLYGRLVGRHIGKHLPGQPTVVPQNMPGASGFRAANYTYAVAPKDGTVLTTLAGGTIVDALIGGKNTDFDASKFTWVGGLSDSTLCISWRGSAVATFDELKKRELIVGGGGNADASPKILNAVLGTKIKLIPGYNGMAAMHLALERGEIEGLCNIAWESIRSLRPQWISERKLNFLLVEGGRRLSELPDTPAVLELARDAADRQALNLVYGWHELMGRAFFAPPDLPDAKVRELQKAFQATLKDPGFLEDAKRLGVHVEGVGGEEVAAFIAELWRTPEPVVARVAAALGRESKR